MEKYGSLLIGVGFVVGVFAGIYLTDTFRPAETVVNGVPPDVCKANIQRYMQETAKKADAMCSQKLKRVAQANANAPESVIGVEEEPPQ